MDGSWCCATDPSACRSLTNLQLRFRCLPLNRHRSLDKCGFLKIGCPHFRKSPNVNRSTRQRPQHPQHNSGTAGPDLELLMRDQASEWCMASAAPKLNKKPVEPDKLERKWKETNSKRMKKKRKHNASKVNENPLRHRAEISRVCACAPLGPKGSKFT